MKSTQSCISTKRKGKRTRLLATLGGLLLLFPLLLPATALAAPRSAAAAPPLTKQQIVDLAGVSVVRLSLEYLPARGTSIFCTTLGTIIASWPAQSASDKNNWVLTDGSLLNPSTRNSCAPGGKLLTIKIFASNEFTNNQPASAQLGLLNCASSGACTDNAAVNGVIGPAETFLTLAGSAAALFSFHTNNPLPYVDVEKPASTTGNPAPTSIELAASATTNAIPPSAKSVDPTRLDQFLTPIVSSNAPTAAGSAPTTPGTTSSQTNEPGMPYIDGNGLITGAQLFNTKSLVTTTNIENLENQLVLPPGQTLSQLLSKNTLSQQWDAGIIQYEQGDNTGAVQTLGSIQNAPPTFLAPAAFKSKAQANLPANTGTTGSTTTATNGQDNHGALLGIPLVVIGLITLVSLFLLVSIRFGRRRIERKQELGTFKADEERARQRVERKERQEYVPPQPYMGVDKYSVAAAPKLRCPNCGAPVDEHTDFCLNCHYSLKPAGAESHRYPSPPEVLAPISTDARPTAHPQQPAQVPQMQDDPAIQATLQRLWDKAGR